jgi:hypothetical protein
MAVSIEQRDDCLDQSAAMWGSVGRRSSRGSERLIVVPGITACAGINASPLFPEQVVNLVAMDRQDLVPEIVNQFEHGEGDLRWPEARYLDENRTQMGGSLLRAAHALPPRR